MTIKFEDLTTELGSPLLCPSCGGNYIHHGKIEVFAREEDAETGLHVTVENVKASIDNELKDNPSLWRHGVKIHFWCEHCNAKPVLSLTQHKGNSWFNFEEKKQQVSQAAK